MQIAPGALHEEFFMESEKCLMNDFNTGELKSTFFWIFWLKEGKSIWYQVLVILKFLIKFDLLQLSKYQWIQHIQLFSYSPKLHAYCYIWINITQVTCLLFSLDQDFLQLIKWYFYKVCHLDINNSFRMSLLLVG